MALTEGFIVDYRTAAGVRAPRPKQPGTRRLSRTRRLHSLVAVLATVALTFGGSLAMASTATAATGDQIVVDDPNLENEVNEELENPAGTPVIEGDPDLLDITSLDATSGNIFRALLTQQWVDF